MRLGIAPEPYRMWRVGEISDLSAQLEPFCIMPIGFASGKFFCRHEFEPQLLETEATGAYTHHTNHHHTSVRQSRIKTRQTNLSRTGGRHMRIPLNISDG